MAKTNSTNDIAYVRTKTVPPSPPPANITGLQGWARENLFPAPLQSVLTLIMAALAAYVIWMVADWAIIKAVFAGDSGEACRGEGNQEGACWPMATARFGQWIYGFYPFAERWRVNIVFIVGVLALVPMLMPSLPYKSLNAIFLLAIYPIMTLILLTGGNFNIDGSTWISASLFIAVLVIPILFLGFIAKILEPKIALISSAVIVAITTLLLLLFSINFGLKYVETSQWGGLLVTLVVAVTGIVASLPIGILLALGRRSQMPVVKLFSVAFIELWRGVPLITVLFMASVVLPLFLPPGTNFDKLLRALVGVALFSSAYMAEVVRGGLQAIPKGQTEAAQALGLTFWQNMGLITLPQALKLVIPGIVNTFIGLFKDTTLVGIIGLYDLLLIIGTANTDQNWAAPQTHSTGLFSAALIFWIFCFAMSRYSMFMERQLDTGHKN